MVYALPEVRLLVCVWGEFGNWLKGMRNRKEALAELKKTCSLAVNIFTNSVSPHSVYLGREQKGGAVVLEKAMELMKYNLNLYVELEEKYPFSAWK